MLGALNPIQNGNKLAPSHFNLQIEGGVGLNGLFFIRKKISLAYTLPEDCYLEISVCHDKPCKDKLVLLNTEKMRGFYIMDFDAGNLDKGWYKIVMTACSVRSKGIKLFSKEIDLGIME